MYINNTFIHLFLHVHGCFVHMYVCVPHTRLVPTEVRRECWIPGIGVPGGCELPCFATVNPLNR